MTDLLKEAINKAKLLSPEMQDEVAEQLLFEIENELKWQKETSLEKLTVLAGEALQESNDSKTIRLH
ncbi:MAG: hypothetical protein M0Q21_00495 [Ignavibacteriaceae bacterium]|nr:hypothetical protein [Ignavibacteriaceae bacterium]